jgi:gluconate 5-dehydrogenase
MRTTQELFSLAGKTALVTGGSRGLGLQMALALGEQGARLVITSRKKADLDEAVAFLSEHGVSALAIPADLSKESDAKTMVDGALAHLGHIDILINNAGATWGAPAEDYPLEAWDKVMNLNIRSIFHVSQMVGKRSMIPRQFGRIINIASIAGFSGNPPGMQTIAYNTSKAAVINFTRTLAAEWGVHGITVNALAPGFFPTRMAQGLIDKLGHDKMASAAPLRRLGDDEDLKGATVLFASDAGKHITGQTLAVDGGVSAV